MPENQPVDLGGRLPMGAKFGFKPLGQARQDGVQFAHQVKVYFGVVLDHVLKEPGNLGDDFVSDDGDAVGIGSLGELQDLQVFFLAVEGHAGYDQVGFKGTQEASDMLQLKVEPIGVHNFDVKASLAKGSGALENGQGRINRTDIAVFVSFLADDRKVFYPRRID